MKIVFFSANTKRNSMGLAFEEKRWLQLLGEDEQLH